MNEMISPQCTTLPSVESHSRDQTGHRHRRCHCGVQHEQKVLHSVPFQGASIQVQIPQHSSTNIYIVLRSSEIIASFQLLSIIHVTIVLPHRWLTGNVHLLAADNVGITDIAEVAQLIHNTLDKIASDGQLVLDQDFMMGILDPIKEQVPEFKEYMEFMLEEHTCFGVGSRLEANKKLLYDELLAELFYPARMENIEKMA